MESRPSLADTNAVSEILQDDHLQQSDESPVDPSRHANYSKAKLLSPPPEYAVQSLATLVTPVRHTSPGEVDSQTSFQFTGILSQLDSKIKNLNERKKPVVIEEQKQRENPATLIKKPSYLEGKQYQGSPKSSRLDELFQRLSNKKVGSPPFKAISNMGAQQQDIKYAYGSSALGMDKQRSKSPPRNLARLDLKDTSNYRSKSGEKPHTREFERTLKELEQRTKLHLDRNQTDIGLRDKDDDLSRGLVISQIVDSQSPYGLEPNQKSRPEFLLDRGAKRPKFISSSREMKPNVQSLHSDAYRDDQFDTRSIDLVSKHSGAGDAEFQDHLYGQRHSLLGGDASKLGTRERATILQRSRSPNLSSGTDILISNKPRDLQERFRLEKAKIERKAKLEADGILEREGLVDRHRSDAVARLVPMNHGLEFSDSMSAQNKFERFSKKAAEMTQSLVAQLNSAKSEEKVVSVLENSRDKKPSASLMRGSSRSRSRSKSPSGDFKRWLEGDSNSFAKEEPSGSRGSRSPHSRNQTSALDFLYNKLADRVFHQPSSFVKKRALGAKLNSKGAGSKSPSQYTHQRLVTTNLEHRGIKL